MTSVDQSHNISDRYDKFCWNCHKRCTTISCPTCFRSFHERQGHLKMLKHTMVAILNNPDFRVFKDLSALKKEAKYCDDVVNPIDLNEIDRKICRELYDSFYAFLVDIDCIYLNCFVYYGERHDLTRIARKMFEICTLEIEAISSCAECYENKHLHPMEWRTMTCNKPHLVLWAKLSRSVNFLPAKRGFTHWPAKLISIDDKSLINLKVIFFESSGLVDISALDCWLYSAKDASSLNPGCNPNYIEATLKEVDLYGKNIEKKFGRFQSDLERIKFVREHLNDHMAAMFPDYDGSAKVMAPSQIPPIDAEIDDRPAKRSRLSTDTAANPNHGSTKAVSITKHMQLIEREITELENANHLKAQQMLDELNRSKGALDVAHDDNRKLEDALRTVSSERDEAKEAMVEANEEAAIQAELIKAMKEKIELFKKLNGLCGQKLGKAIADIERVQEEWKTVEEKLQKATRDHEHEMNALRTQLSNDGWNKLLKLQTKLQKEHDDELGKLCQHHEKQLECEKNRVSIEIQKWKEEQQRKLADMKNKIQAAVDESF